jgi:hypothetical protein
VSEYHIGRRGQVVPHSGTVNKYPGRTPHWIRGNAQERIPHRWIVADTESERIPLKDGEQLKFKVAGAVRWRDDLATGTHEERAHFWDAAEFWKWVIGYTWTHGRTCIAFHNAGHDLGQTNAFQVLPDLGCELVWCNLDRDVSVTTWSTPGGTLLVWDTWTWTAQGLDQLAGMVGMGKTPLPRRGDPPEVWVDRVMTDVEITRRVVEQLLDYVRTQHLGNWQPSGAGMGHTAWRHRFMTHKVLVHDDQDAIDAERAAMHAGRAEAWWHGKPGGGPFTEWDMHMSYCRIAAECLVPGKLWDFDPAPSRKVHQFGLDHWRTLAEVTVSTEIPVVPVKLDGRITWPVGEFRTYLWDTELSLITQTKGKYKVHNQWRYTRKPALQEWAKWSMAECTRTDSYIHPVAKTWVKHQSRAVIGRMGLRTPSWEYWGENWMDHSGISLLTDTADGSTTRMMHVGSKVLRETGRTEAANAVPQITSWIMSEARRRLWAAATAAGLENVLHVDTDSLITNRAGTARLKQAIASGLEGGWRPKSTWKQLEITGPRHYSAPGRKQVPGVPRRAVEQPDGTFKGEIWDSLARSLTEAPGEAGRIRERTWTPRRIDHRRPYQGEENGPALPIRTGPHQQEEVSSDNEQPA